MPLTAVIVPFRDRGVDPLRSLNLTRVLAHWEAWGHSPWVVTDGRTNKELFNRSAAYNRGIAHVDPDTEIFIFAESDMLCPIDQIDEAVEMADTGVGMVVPFSSYCYHSPENSVEIRKGDVAPGFLVPKWRMDECKSIGAINVMSRKTIDMFGQFDEKFEGNWFDDDAMKMAIEVCTGQPTRFVQGQAHHLYHLPGHRGKHLSDLEKRATRHNAMRLAEYERSARTKNVAYIRRLLKGEV